MKLEKGTSTKNERIIVVFDCWCVWDVWKTPLPNMKFPSKKSNNQKNNREFDREIQVLWDYMACVPYFFGGVLQNSGTTMGRWVNLQTVMYSLSLFGGYSTYC